MYRELQRAGSVQWPHVAGGLGTIVPLMIAERAMGLPRLCVLALRRSAALREESIHKAEGLKRLQRGAHDKRKG